MIKNMSQQRLTCSIYYLKRKLKTLSFSSLTVTSTSLSTKKSVANPMNTPPCNKRQESQHEYYTQNTTHF